METLQITTGEKRIPVTRDGTHAGEVVFNPSDVIFAEKFYKIVSEFESTLHDYQSRYDELEKDSKGQPMRMDESLSLLHETCQYVREKIDYVFGVGTSQIVFGDAMVLEVFPQFFDGITPFVQSIRAEKIAQYLPKPNGNGHAKKSRKRKV